MTIYCLIIGLSIPLPSRHHHLHHYPCPFLLSGCGLAHVGQTNGYEEKQGDHAVGGPTTSTFDDATTTMTRYDLSPPTATQQMRTMRLLPTSMIIMRVMANCHYSTTVNDYDIHRRSTTTASLTHSMTLATHGQVTIPINHAS